MNLEELLEYTAKQFLDDRTDLVDGDPDELWSDSFLVRQFNQAQRIFARRAWCITEYGETPAGVITLTEGKTLYKLHKSVIRVYDATPDGQDIPLGRADDIAIRSPYPPGMDAWDIGVAASLAGGTLINPGAPLVFASDAAWRTLRVTPAPSSTQEGLKVYLKIARYHLTDLTLSNTKGCPEIPEEYHMDICEYAAGKALTLPNADADNKAEGRKLLESFNAAVKEARRDRQRAERNGSRWGFASSTAVIR